MFNKKFRFVFGLFVFSFFLSLLFQFSWQTAYAGEIEMKVKSAIEQNGESFHSISSDMATDQDPFVRNQIKTEKLRLYAPWSLLPPDADMPLPDESPNCLRFLMSNQHAYTGCTS